MFHFTYFTLEGVPKNFYCFGSILSRMCVWHLLCYCKTFRVSTWSEFGTIGEYSYSEPRAQVGAHTALNRPADQAFFSACMCKDGHKRAHLFTQWKNESMMMNFLRQYWRIVVHIVLLAVVFILTVLVPLPSFVVILSIFACVISAMILTTSKNYFYLVPVLGYLIYAVVLLLPI